MPVILSIENHCSWDQQKMMADIIKHELGVMVQRPGTGVRDGRLPTLSELKRKIILKGKMSPSETEESDDDEPVDPTELALATQGEEAAALGAAVAVKANKRTPGTHPDLSGLIFLGTASAKDLSQSSYVPCDVMSSYSESKVQKLVRNESTVAAWVAHNAVHMSRAYPKGTRVNSSNMDPLPAWSAGVQMVALNYQHYDTPMFLNHGKFLQNHNCGYVLKPFYMRHAGSTHLGERTIEVHVFGGHHIPKPGSVPFGEVIDPYVMVNMCGVDGDSAEHRTRTVDNNGFNPIWDEVDTMVAHNSLHKMLKFNLFTSRYLHSRCPTRSVHSCYSAFMMQIWTAMILSDSHPFRF